MQVLNLENRLHNSAIVLRKLPWISLLALFGVALSLPAAFPDPNQTTIPCSNDSKGCVTSELTGAVATRPGGRLRLATDLGNVTIHATKASKVSYHVHLEADASQKDAEQLVKEFKVN